MASPELVWLPPAENWRERIAAVARDGDFPDLLGLARSRLDFVQTNAVDQILRRRWPERPATFDARPVRLVLLGSSTLGHLGAALRVAGLRANLWLDVYEGGYGQMLQEFDDPRSGLHAFRPDVVLFAQDSERFAAGVNAADSGAAVEDALARLKGELVALWRKARAAGMSVLQQTAIASAPALLGANEHRLPGSRAAYLARVNVGLREWADVEGVDLVALDVAAARDGLAAWRDPALWARAKQEVRPAAAPMYGELVVRLLAARLGRSRKCLVLDLDNTLWGGVIGDDGLNGIVLGQGSALGEGFLAVQAYAKELSRRGIILAVCSKNDEANAWEPFDKHPEMILRRADIACFVANWDDKAANIRLIAQSLNIGIDSLVFLDDNPFERTRVREALPMVAVPEVPDEPALVPDVLAAAGYFEAVALTAEDRLRTEQYRGNTERAGSRENFGDLAAYLASLQMRLIWGWFDETNRQRIVQLVNKTNQFNLTTRRYTEADYDSLMRDADVVGLHLRLIDRFGDNGLIAVVIARQEDEALAVDSWLMSCRVLGREVERATLGLLVEEARARGLVRLIGDYIPTAKNGIVRDLYERLGFSKIEEDGDGRARFALDVAGFEIVALPMTREAA
jgi:FkbH-like protein